MPAYHLATFAAIRIIFLPHLVCLSAFLPLERVARLAWARTTRPAAAPA